MEQVLQLWLTSHDTYFVTTQQQAGPEGWVLVSETTVDVPLPTVDAVDRVRELCLNRAVLADDLAAIDLELFL